MRVASAYLFQHVKTVPPAFWDGHLASDPSGSSRSSLAGAHSRRTYVCFPSGFEGWRRRRSATAKHSWSVPLRHEASLIRTDTTRLGPLVTPLDGRLCIRVNTDSMKKSWARTKPAQELTELLISYKAHRTAAQAASAPRWAKSAVIPPGI